MVYLSYVCRLVGIGFLEDNMNGNNTNRAEDIENEYPGPGKCKVLAQQKNSSSNSFHLNKEISMLCFSNAIDLKLEYVYGHYLNVAYQRALGTRMLTISYPFLLLATMFVSKYLKTV